MAWGRRAVLINALWGGVYAWHRGVGHHFAPQLGASRQRSLARLAERRSRIGGSSTGGREKEKVRIRSRRRPGLIWRGQGNRRGDRREFATPHKAERMAFAGGLES